MKTLIKSTEAKEQQAFLHYLDYKKIPYYANVNENIWSGIIKGMLSAVIAIKIISSIENKMKSLGKKKGIPDLFLPVIRGVYGGMYVEMKYGKNKVTKEQLYWLTLLKKQGYHCVVCYSAKEAIIEFERYNKVIKYL